MNEKSILLAGLPSTGKTTFIAALWFYLNNPSKQQALKLNSLAGSEHEYLNSISRDWLTYNTVTRTRSNNGEKIQINIKNTQTDQIINLDIPDFSGETFKSHFDTREWTNEYDKLLNKINGLILFINPHDTNNRPLLVNDLNEGAALLGDTEIVTNDGVEFEPYNTDHTSNQVKLVEELQFINHQKPKLLPLKIAIVISAWDEIENLPKLEKQTPISWLEKHMPLLYQYLVCNGSNYIMRTYGISAQGLSYNEKNIAKALDGNRLDHIIIKEGTEISKDISKPIVWITE